MTFDYFHFGKHDLMRAALKIAVTAGRITSKSNLTNVIGILSNPSEFDLILRFASNTSISVTDRNENLINDASTTREPCTWGELVRLKNNGQHSNILLE